MLPQNPILEYFPDRTAVNLELTVWMNWHIGLSQNPKPQSHRLSSFYPSKVFKHVILGVSLFSDTQLLYHMLLIVIYIYNSYVYIPACSPICRSSVQRHHLHFCQGEHLHDMFFFPRYYPEFKMFGTHPIIMLLVCVCVSLLSP